MAIIFDDMGNEMYDDGGMSFPTSVNYDLPSTGGIAGNYDPTAYGNGWLDSTNYGYNYGGDYFGDSPTPTSDPINDYNYSYGGNYDWGTTAEQIPNTAKEGETGYGWSYYSDGTAISPTGAYYHQGQLLYDSTKPTSGITGDMVKKFGTEAFNALKGAFTKKMQTVQRAQIGVKSQP